MTDPPHRFVILFSKNFSMGTIHHMKPKRNGQGAVCDASLGGWSTNDRSYGHLVKLAKFVIQHRGSDESEVSAILEDLFPMLTEEFDMLLLDLSREALVRAAGGEVDRAV